MVYTIAQESYEDKCFKVFCRNLRREIQKKILWEILETMTEKEKSNVLSYVYRLSDDSIEVCSYRIQYGAYLQDMVGVYETLNEMKRKEMPIMLNAPQYWRDLWKCKIPMGIFTKEMLGQEWIRNVEILMQEFGREDREVLYQTLCDGMDKKSFRFYYLTAFWMERRILDKEVGEIVWEELYTTSLYWMACAGMLYKEEVFVSELLEAIPDKYQYGWYLMQANAAKGKDDLRFVQKTAQAAKVYPLMKEYCKEMMRKTAKEQ